jgi:orotidine-5'-phosphate decarboxylase
MDTIVKNPKDRIILPLDTSSVTSAKALADMLSPHVGPFKIGLEFIYSTLASLVLQDEEAAVTTLRELRGLMKAVGASAFWDGKLDDIPNTVKGASIAISSMGVRMFNVHASAGIESIKAAVENRGNAEVLGVTVLTSISGEECISCFGEEPDKKVLRFAVKLLEAKAQGLICSPKELGFLRGSSEFKSLKMVTPGVRPEWASLGDQKRVMTPGEAILAGADYLVIGRPITKPPTQIGGPVQAAIRIAGEIEQAMKQRECGRVA